MQTPRDGLIVMCLFGISILNEKMTNSKLAHNVIISCCSFFPDRVLMTPDADSSIYSNFLLV